MSTNTQSTTVTKGSERNHGCRRHVHIHLTGITASAILLALLIAFPAYILNYLNASSIDSLETASTSAEGSLSLSDNSLANSLLAQIISVEASLLKKWQEHGPLKRNLTAYSSGQDVALAQQILAQDPELYPEAKITGRFGPLTRRAVLNFQKEYNLPETGIIDTATRKRMNTVMLEHLCPKANTVEGKAGAGNETGATADAGSPFDTEVLMMKIRPVTVQDGADNRSTFIPPAIPRDYVPPRLEYISNKVLTSGTMCLRADVAPWLEAMFAAAERDGVKLMVTSAFRRPEIQKYLYDFWTEVEGDDALDEIAKPGTSEHQLGSAVDLTDASVGYAGVADAFADSLGGKWLAAHAHKYGFTMSFPKGREEVTGFAFEPWHWRYVGVEAATKVKNDVAGRSFNEGE